MFPSSLGSQSKCQQSYIDVKIMREDITNRKYTDCTITFIDNQRSIDMSCHKIVLLSASEYFRNAFSCGNTNHIIMKCDNSDARIMYDIVLSFYEPEATNCNLYGYPGWEYLLQSFICRDYILLNNNVNQLYDLKVPKQGFELLMRVLAVYDLEKNENLLKVVRDNLPTGYNLPDRLQKILSKKYAIMTCTNDKINTWDIESGTLINSFSHNGCKAASISWDGKLIVTINNKQVDLWNDCGSLMREILTPHYHISCILISHNKKFIILHELHQFHIWSTESGQLIRTVDTSVHRKQNLIAISYDDKTVAYLSRHDSIHIQNVEDGQLIHDLHTFDSTVHSIAFSHDDKFIVCGTRKTLIIWNIENQSRTHTFPSKYPIYDLVISHDSRFILTNTIEKMDIWDTTNQLSIFHKYNVQLLCGHTLMSHDNSLIALQSFDINNIQNYTVDIFKVSDGELVTTLPQNGFSYCIVLFKYWY